MGDAGTDPALFPAFAAVAVRQPDRLAVDDGVCQLSYAALRDAALQLGARVAERVSPGGLVGVLLPSCAAFPVAWLACLAARIPFLPLDPDGAAEHNRTIATEAGITAVIVPTAAGVPAWLTDRTAVIPIEPTEPKCLGPSACTLPPAEVGLVLFTSGSTGRPKGIAWHESSQVRKALDYRQAPGLALAAGDRLLTLHPPMLAACARDVFSALLCGATLDLADVRRAGLGRVLEAMRDRKISVCATIPTMVRALAAIDGAPAAFRALRVLRIGGDRLLGSDVALLTRLLSPDARILATFGMTEAGGTLMQRVIDPRQPIESGSIAVGWPVPDQEVTVADENGRPVAGGAAGELVIGGRNIALGHWIDGRLDRTAFVADPSIPDVRRYRTGDLVRVRPDGMFVPLGRLDRQAKINGLRIEPGETEAALRRHPGVADAVVLVDQGDGHARLVAFVVAAPGWSAGRLLPDLKPGVAACLPSQLVPGRIHLVPAIPLLPSLKPDVATLWRAARRTTAGGPLGRAWIRLRRTTSDRRAWTK